MAYRMRVEEDEVSFLQDALNLEYEKLAQRMKETGEPIPKPFHRLRRRVEHTENYSAGQKTRHQGKNNKKEGSSGEIWVDGKRVK
jgi:hypothetical protein